MIINVQQTYQLNNTYTKNHFPTNQEQSDRRPNPELIRVVMKYKTKNQVNWEKYLGYFCTKIITTSH